MKKTIPAFCANCQEETPHTVSVQDNGEILLTCICDRFIKLPADLEPDGVKTCLDEHKAANEGQLTVERLEDAKNKLIAAFNEADEADK